MTTTSAAWRPRLGARVAGAGFRFEVSAPTRQRVDLLLHPSTNRQDRVPLDSQGDGYFAVTLQDVKPGDRSGVPCPLT
jgi:1,4-alpha-glucan branching enzyme